MIVDPMLLDYMADHSGSCTFVLREVPADKARLGLQRAGEAVAAIPHPEEPDDPLPSYVAPVDVADDGSARLTIDIADGEAYDGLLERVLDAVLDGLAAAGVAGGLLTYPAEPVSDPAAVAPPGPSMEHLPSPAMATSGWSPVGLPIPEPNQELWCSGSTDSQAAGYMVPHTVEAALTHFEALPGVVLSWLSTPPGDMVAGGVVIHLGGHLFTVTVRDAGTARNVEVTRVLDPVRAERTLSETRAFRGAADVRVRVDNR